MGGLGGRRGGGRGKVWVEVSAERLRGNFAELRRAAGMPALAVIKADAYGHGACLCAPVLVGAGARWLGVTDAAEGAAVRDALSQGSQGKGGAGLSDEGAEREEGGERPGEAEGEGRSGVEILVMSGSLPEDAGLIVECALTPVVWTVDQMGALAAEVRRRRRGVPLPVHLEVDTGMSRQGVVPGAAMEEVLGWLGRCPELRLGGLMTHFASAEVERSPQTAEQRARFAEAVEAVRRSGLQPEWVHAGNTSAIEGGATGPVAVGEEGHGAWLARMAARLGAQPMMRSGLGLYGYRLPTEVYAEAGGSGLRLVAAAEDREAGEAAEETRGEERLRPAMAWKTRVLAVEEIATGARVGYNGTFRARWPMRLALLPVGYADGLRRELSSSDGEDGGWVRIRGQRAPVVGRVSMNLTTVDVTRIAGVEVGEEVTLLGEGVTAADGARVAGTIAYEILCGVRTGERVLV